MLLAIAPWAVINPAWAKKQKNSNEQPGFSSLHLPTWLAVYASCTRQCIYIGACSCDADVCLYVCISVAMSNCGHLFHIYTRPTTESILCERGSCLRGKRQIVLTGVWPQTPWSHLGRAAFTKCANDMIAVHDVTESFCISRIDLPVLNAVYDYAVRHHD